MISTELRSYTFDTNSKTIAAAWTLPSFLLVKMTLPLTIVEMRD